MFDETARKPFTSARVRTYGKFAVGPGQPYKTVSSPVYQFLAPHAAPTCLPCPASPGQAALEASGLSCLS